MRRNSDLEILQVVAFLGNFYESRLEKKYTIDRSYYDFDGRCTMTRDSGMKTLQMVAIL